MYINKPFRPNVPVRFVFYVFLYRSHCSLAKSTVVYLSCKDSEKFVFTGKLGKIGLFTRSRNFIVTTVSFPKRYRKLVKTESDVCYPLLLCIILVSGQIRPLRSVPRNSYFALVANLLKIPTKEFTFLVKLKVYSMTKNKLSCRYILKCLTANVEQLQCNEMSPLPLLTMY